MKKCINCNHNLSLHYCENCGQSADTSRIDWKFCSREIFYNNFTFHNKTINTLMSLLKNPGLMIRNFLIGKRMGYIGAIQLLFFVLVIQGILMAIFNEPGKVSESVLDINGHHIDLQRYTKSMMVIFILLSSFGTRITYKRYGFILPEHLVINFYIISFSLLFSGIIRLLT